MRQLLLAVMLLFFSAWTASGFCSPAPPVPATPDTATGPSTASVCALRIHATGFRSKKGLADAAVFASPDGWPEEKDKTVADDAIPISGHEATFTFKLPPGNYGVVVLHDENENQKLDRNFLGIPTEGFGFANNPRVFLTAPSFVQATVPVTCPVTTIQVKIIYK